MRYTVLSVAYPLTPVGPDAVGGSEQILSLLDEAITRAGHRSIVIAAEGSTVSGTLIASPAANGHLDDQIRRRGQHTHQLLIAETLRKFSVDLIHMHSLDFHCYLPDAPIPVLATLHLPPDWYPASIFSYKRASFYLNCVSASQQFQCPPCAYMLPYIANGIGIGTFENYPKKSYALALGRICPEKGFHYAMQAALMAQHDLILAGKVFPYAAHRDYFRTEIEPLIDERRRFIGPVGMARKRRLLAEACCLLVPSTVAETSSLVAMEAFAAGTPVVAFAAGALPEIVEHGRNGFLVKDVAEMAAAIGQTSAIDPKVCHNSARQRFSAEQMIRRYFHAYERIIENATEWASDRRSQSSSLAAI